MNLADLWFWIVAFLFVGYFVLDGFDFGVGMALPLLGRTDNERRVILNTIGPVWDLNETWVLVAGACLFAAFPEWYASLFSAAYLALLLILLALIARGVALEYRHRRPDVKWRSRFDLMITIGSALSALLWGVAFANVVRGIPLDADHHFTGWLGDLLNPYAILGGFTTLLLFATHGLTFLALKTTDDLRDRARGLALWAGGVTVPVAAAFLLWTGIAYGTAGFWVGAVLAALALVGSWVATFLRRDRLAFWAGVVTIAAAVGGLFAALFPNVLPSFGSPAHSLTVANASSSAYTLQIMTWVALVCLPFVLVYQAWTYWVFRRRITLATVGDH